jgi:rhodanese-related sulfurtransferase
MNQSNIVTPDQAQSLLGKGAAYVDVRNPAEFENGHPAGAYNVPLILDTDSGSKPNEAFVDDVKRHFALDAKLVIGCATGVRSSQAVRLLTNAGFSNVVDLSVGYNGSRDPFGRKSPGWRDLGLPVEMGQPEGRSYRALAESTKPDRLT